MFLDRFEQLVGRWTLELGLLEKFPADYDDPSGHKITGRDNKDSTILMKDHVVSDLLLNQGQPICLQLQCQPVASTQKLIKQTTCFLKNRFLLSGYA